MSSPLPVQSGTNSPSPCLPYSPPRSPYQSSSEKDTTPSTTTSSTPFLPSHTHHHQHSSSSLISQHSRTTSLASLGPTSGGWWNAVSRKIAQRNLGRRAVLVGLLGLVAVVTLFSATTAGSEEEREEGRGWYGKAREAFQGLGLTGNVNGEKEEMRKLDLLKVINFETPQETLASQLKDGVRYATAMSYGGHANQMISIQKLLYFAKITNRVPIIPSLIPVHIDGPPTNISLFYDLPRFFHLTSLPALEMSQLKLPTSNNAPQEPFPCWSIQESTVGFPNFEAISFDMHGLYVHHWPLPGDTFARGAGGFDLSFDSLRIWDSNSWEKDRWIERVRSESLPQKKSPPPQDSDSSKEKAEVKEGKENIKDGFKVWDSPSPTDQVVAFDNSLFLGPIMFPPIDLSPASAPLEPSLAGEGTSWISIGQHLHFTPHLERIANEYLMSIFQVSTPSKIPPFISVHLRRGDFEQFTGAYTSLEKYSSALDRLLPRLQARLDDPLSFSGPSRRVFNPQHPKLKAKDYEVLCTTDEKSDSPFVKEVLKKGWKIVDHSKETGFDTKGKLGGWYPTLVDMKILSMGKSFVGTDRSTYTHLAGLRVKYWNGGVVEIA